jgi:Xaa-Pro aminopeptidase
MKKKIFSSQETFAQRRQRLMAAMLPNSIAIIFNAPLKQRNADVFYPYRPDSDFYYLSGFEEPNALMVLLPQRENGEYLLFCQEKNFEEEQIFGERVGLENACSIYKADDAFPFSDIDDILTGLLESRQQLYYSLGKYSEFDTQVLEWLHQLKKYMPMGSNPPIELVQVDRLIGELRLIKDHEELACIQHAVNLSCEALIHAMQLSQENVQEYEIAAQLKFDILKRGAQLAYPPMVASGKNACVFHYNFHNSTLKNGELVLIDVGAEYNFYASDVARTFPINGCFSEPQKILYEIVLKARQAALEEIRPKNHWNEPHQAALWALTLGLKEAGLLMGKTSQLFEEEAYLRFFSHRTGHWLGLDVHDSSSYKTANEWRIFKSGMVLSIEPALYVFDNQEDIPTAFWKMGVRIEDNILVTETGYEILSKKLPTTVVEIEQFLTRPCDSYSERLKVVLEN